MLLTIPYSECSRFQGNRLHRGVLCATIRRIFVRKRWFFIIVFADDGYKVWLLIVVMPIHKPDSKLALLNSVALVRTRTIPTERPPPVGEVSANFCG